MLICCLARAQSSAYMNFQLDINGNSAMWKLKMSGTNTDFINQLWPIDVWRILLESMLFTNVVILLHLVNFRNIAEFFKATLDECC